MQDNIVLSVSFSEEEGFNIESFSDKCIEDEECKKYLKEYSAKFVIDLNESFFY